MKHNRKYNLFIALLRFWLCIGVVCIHFPVSGWKGLLFLSRSEAVPVFFFLAFFFFSIHLETLKKFQDVTERLRRLIAPLIGWAIIYYVVLCVKNYQLLPISRFIWQLFTGHSLNPAMWFQVDLIAITTLFAFLFIYLPRRIIYPFLIAFFVISFIFQYLGLNYLLWNPLRFELRYPLGRLIEMLPYSCAGVLTAIAFYCDHSPSIMLIDKLKCLLQNAPQSYRFLFSLFAGVIYLLIKKYLAIIPTPNGFGYCGVYKFLCSLSLIFFVLLIPNYDCAYKAKIESVCKIFTKYTLGIYCAHLLVGKLLEPCFRNLGLEGSLWVVIGIYICSYFLCFAIDRLFKKYGKYLVN